MAKHICLILVVTIMPHALIDTELWWIVAVGSSGWYMLSGEHTSPPDHDGSPGLGEPLAGDNNNNDSIRRHAKTAATKGNDTCAAW